MGDKREREEEKEEYEMETVKRRCAGCVSVEAFVNFLSRVRIRELWWSFLG